MTLVELLPFAAIAAAFWLLIIRPASVRRKAQAALVASLEPGQRIMTTAGVFGTVVAMDAERVSLEVAPGVVIEMLAQAVALVVPAEPGELRSDERAAETDAPSQQDAVEPAAPVMAPAVEPAAPAVRTPDDPPADEPRANPALTPEADRG